VKLTTPKVQQWATVTTTGGYLSSDDPRAHFGLGKERIAQNTGIRWPSGIVQVLRNIAADQILLVDEPGVTPTNRPKH
jgi:hypothetical protein